MVPVDWITKLVLPRAWYRLSVFYQDYSEGNGVIKNNLCSDDNLHFTFAKKYIFFIVLSFEFFAFLLSYFSSGFYFKVHGGFLHKNKFTRWFLKNGHTWPCNCNFPCL